MASKVPAGQPASIEVTYSTPGLDIGVEIFDDSGSVPVQVTGLAGMVGNVLPLLNFRRNSYRFKHAGEASRWYLYQIACYTDGSFSTVDQDEPQGSDSVFFEATVIPPVAAALASVSGEAELVVEQDIEAAVAVVEIVNVPC